MQNINEPTNSVDGVQQIAVVMQLNNQFRSSLNWFYWIAGLSLLNSLLLLAGANWNFIVGLGITQFIDVIAMALASEASNTAGVIIKSIGFGLDSLVAAFFILCGWIGKKGHQWLIIVGIVLYALDSIVFLLAQDLFAVAFHALAIFNLVSGLRSYRKLQAIENWQTLLPITPKVVRGRNYWLKLSIIPLIAFACLAIFIVSLYTMR